MHCDESRAAIHSWLDDPGRTLGAEAAAHIAVCSECREFVRTWNAIEVGMRRVRDEAPEVGPLLEGRIRVAVDRAARRPATILYRWWRLPAAGTATLAAVALLILLVWFGRSLTRTSVTNPMSPSAPMAHTR